MATALEPDPTAVFGRRVGAVFIDGALVIIPAVLVASTQVEYADEAKRVELGAQADADTFCDVYVDQSDGACVAVNDTVYFDDGDAGLLGWGLLMGLSIVMYVLLQGLTGWTVGKLLTGIRTVREDGTRPGILKALVRWLMWIVDSLPFLGLVAFITGLTTVGHRRVGDMVAKTFVVRSSAVGAPIRVGVVGTDTYPPPPPGSPAAPAFPPPSAKPGPQWDEARGTYIQWDPEQSAWMQWDDAAKVWEPIATPASTIPDPPPPPT